VTREKPQRRNARLLFAGGVKPVQAKDVQVQSDSRRQREKEKTDRTVNKDVNVGDQ